MAECRTFVQIVALWGLGILMPVVPAMAAAPQCSSVFQDSTFDVEGTLHSLARMKLQIDLGLAKGTDQDMILKIMSTEFRARWNDLLSKTSATVKPEVMKERLRTLIFDLQNKNETAKSEEQSQRQAQSEKLDEHLPASRKVLKLDTVLRDVHPVSRPRAAFIEYFFDEKVVLFGQQTGNLVKLDLSKNQLTHLGLRGAYGRVPGTKEVVYITESGDIKILNVQGQVQRQLGKIPQKILDRIQEDIQDANVVVSASGEQLALVGNADVVFFNVKDGKAWRLRDKLNTLSDVIQKVVFHSEIEAVVYMRDPGRVLSGMSANLKKKEVDFLDDVEFLNEVVRDSKLNRNIVFVDEMDQFGNVTLIAKAARGMKVDNQPLFTVPLPRNNIPWISAEGIGNTDLILLNRYIKGKNQLEIYKLGQDKPVFQFEEFNLSSEVTEARNHISGIAFTDDHRHAVIIYRETLSTAGTTTEHYKLDLVRIPLIP